MISSDYYIISGISILCLLVNLLHLKELDLINKDAIRQLRFLACFVITEIIVDTLFKAFEGDPNVAPIVLYILKALEFIMNPILPYLILRLFNTGKRRSNTIKWIQYFQIGIIIVNVVLQIISLFGNFMFNIDSENLYHRTNLTNVYAAVLISSTVLMVIAVYIYSHKVQNTSFLTLCGLCLILYAGFTLRFIFQNSNYDWLCVSISFFVIDIYYVDLSLRVDPLTRLLNRQVYQTMIDRINFTTAVIMIDANCLKTVNDTHGHECGDKTLHSIAKCILKVYGDYGWCFRIGGDEFCIILKQNAFKTLVDNTPQSDVYVMLERLTKKLDAAITERSRRDKGDCLQYGVSQGYAIYYHPFEYPSKLDNMPLNKVIDLADQLMYNKKKIYKAKLAEEDPSAEQEHINDEVKDRPRVVYNSSRTELIESPDSK